MFWTTSHKLRYLKKILVFKFLKCTGNFNYYRCLFKKDSLPHKEIRVWNLSPIPEETGRIPMARPQSISKPRYHESEFSRRVDFCQALAKNFIPIFAKYLNILCCLKSRSWDISWDLKIRTLTNVDLKEFLAPRMHTINAMTIILISLYI